MHNKYNNIDNDTLNAAKRGDTSALMSNLSDDERKKVQEALGDKDKLKSILSSDIAQQLIKLLGGKDNG